MYAGLFEIDGWMGKRLHIFSGESASEMLDEFQKIQSLDCLLRMGRARENTVKAQKALNNLETILDAHDSNRLTIDDLLGFDLELSIGSMRCVTIVEGDNAEAELREKYPQAK